MTDSRDQLEALLHQAAQGDDSAWRAIVEAWTPRVYALIRANCGSGDLAEEITQSTFVSVATKLREYTEAGRFEAWLFRIAMNRLRDEMRRRRRHATPVESEILAGLAASEAGSSGCDPAILEALRAALSELPDADQHILQLRHFVGLSFREISEVLDQPLGTVLARQHRALRKLADSLGPSISDDF